MKMNRLLALFVISIALLQTFAQEPCELVIKGKKQGVRITATDQWLIPLGKYTIVEPYENLFIKIDKKNQLVQGFFKDDYFEKITDESSSLFFGEYYGMNDVLGFEDGTINIYNHSFTKPRFHYNENGLRGPACGYFKNLLFLAACTDSAGLYIVEISDQKNNIVARFENVEYSIEKGRLLIGKTKQKEYDPVYQVSYDVESVEVYEFTEGSLEKRERYSRNDEKNFQNVLNHIRGYGYEPIFPEDESQKIDYEVFIKTNYKIDSAEKYPFIISDGTGIYFANENERNHLSAEGEWKPVEEEYYNEYHFDEGHSIFSSIREGNLELISSNTYYDDIWPTDEAGQVMYDENGDMIYEEVPPIQKSGVWSWELKSWLIPNEYTDVLFVNNLIVVHKDGNLQLDQVEVFDLVGNKITSIDSLNEIEILEAIYPGSKADSIAGSYQLFKVDREGKQAIIDFGTFRFGIYEIASFEDGVIPGSFNAVTYSYVSYKDGNIYLNEYDVEIGVTSREIKGSFGAFVNTTSSGYNQDEFMSKFSDVTQFEIISGIKRTTNENQFIIYNNIPFTYANESKIEKIDPMYGWTMYDANGNPMYEYYYPKRERLSATGLWNANNQKWSIEPKYNQIRDSKKGFLCVGIEIKKDNDYYYGDQLQDSVTLSYYSNSYETVQEDIQFEEFLSNTSNFKYFIAEEDLGVCLRKPLLINESSYLQDSYSNYWFEAKDGLNLVRKSEERIDVELIARGLDWIYESKYYSYGLKNDSIIIMDNSELKIPGSVSLPVDKEFEIYETMNGVYIFSESGNYQVPAVEFPPLYVIDHDNNDITEQVFVTIRGNEKEIICSNRYTEELFYGEFFLDDYGGSSEVVLKNDVVWNKNGEKWNIGLIANVIEKTPFGYFVSNNFFLSENNLPWIFYDEDGDVKKEYNQGLSFVAQNFKVLDDLPVTSYYQSVPLEGYEHLFVVKYGNSDNPELMAVISKEGKTVAKDMYSYEIKDGILEYTEAVSDEWGSFPRIDENGNEVKVSIELK